MDKSDTISSVHAIHLNDGRFFEPSGSIARVSVGCGEIVDDICEQVFGEVIDLPAPEG